MNAPDAKTPRMNEGRPANSIMSVVLSTFFFPSLFSDSLDVKLVGVVAVVVVVVVMVVVVVVMVVVVVDPRMSEVVLALDEIVDGSIDDLIGFFVVLPRSSMHSSNES